MRITKTAGAAVAFALAATTFGLLNPTAATQHVTNAAAVKQHGMGLNLEALRKAKAAGLTVEAADATGLQAPLPRAGAAPASFDLSSYALSPGDQGQVGSCVAWATGYTGYGVLMKEQGITGAPMAPMFTYAQIAKGNDQGTDASVALPMQQSQGIDTKAHYWQGDFDYTTQPDASEKANAAKYKLSGYKSLATSGTAAKTAIMDAISQGMPVPIGFTVHQSFMNLNATTAGNYTYLPKAGESVVGGHEVTIVAYNEKGVKIENSWGSSWGAGGYFTVPWSFFNTGDVDEIHAMGKLIAS
ncbi:peptidase [Pseudonocardiaceae bacterium YIM PH 21723]|nr:peptidase [Pseudonocardiaceae bacterium YIM PH 21723]